MYLDQLDITVCGESPGKNFWTKKIFAQKYNMVVVAGWCEDAW